MERSPTAEAPGRPAQRIRVQSECLGLEMEPIKSNQETGTPVLN